MSTEKKKSLQAALVGLVSNALLTVIKLFVGMTFKSQVLIADGIHNAGDVIASAAAFGSMKISGQPADEDHPYGHGKAEVVGAGLVAIILALAALFIGYESVKSLFEPPKPAHIIALLAAFVSLVWKQVLYFYTIRIGRSVNSKGLIATAYDHLADVYASIAAVAGIGLALIGEYAGIPFLSYGDPTAGIVVALLILKLSFEMGKESTDILMDKNIEPEKLNEYARLIRTIPEVKQIDRIRGRGDGKYFLVDVRVSISASLTVQDGHDISRSIKETIMKSHQDVDEVLIHLNPWYDGKKQNEQR